MHPTTLFAISIVKCCIMPYGGLLVILPITNSLAGLRRDYLLNGSVVPASAVGV